MTLFTLLAKYQYQGAFVADQEINMLACLTEIMVECGSIPAAVLVLAKYQYQGAFVADQEINMLACLTEIMVECEFK